MKITFLLHVTEIGGGVRVVFEYANRLTERGHDVTIVYPLIDKKSIKSKLNSVINMTKYISPFHNHYPKWFDLKAKLLPVPTFKEKYIPDADIIVATWWETAYYVSSYEKNKGKKFYLIQHYETWGGPPDKVKKTYTMGLHNIVISSWIKEKLENLGADIDAIILNGVNFNDFYPDKKMKKDDELRVLMPYRVEKWKGISDGVKAFKLVKEKFNNIKLVTFGPKPLEGELPEDVEFHVYPTGNELRKLYNSCDIFLFPSHCEGFGLPPMEAMACELPVVSTDVGAIKDIALPGKTALVSNPYEPIDLSKNIIKLIKNESLRKEIAKSGYEYIKQFNWVTATDKLEELFKKYNEGE
ncbi:MAG: glycosyltransferase family 4 protein [Methanobacterium paludis]|nr:glycosyltransferase family 4 protein [Methanobacterium paludis]